MLLLDSNAFLFWTVTPKVLSASVRGELATSPRLYLSVVSIWELEIKVARGRLSVPPELWDDLPQIGIEVLPIEKADALAAARLPSHHRDPFDRMIVAQALARGLTIVTRDAALMAYGAPILAA